jgi:hypothetical protein
VIAQFFPRWPLVVVGYRRSIQHAVLDAWLRAALNPPRGLS